MSHGKNSSRDNEKTNQKDLINKHIGIKKREYKKPFVHNPKKPNEISTLVIERNPTKFALHLTHGGPVWTIYPVEDTGKYIKDSIDK